MNVIPIMPARRASIAWPEEGLARVPYALFQGDAIYADEQDAILRKPNWSYLCLEVVFRDGIDGKGGMKADFCLADHGLRKLHVATLHGLVFGSFSDDVPPLSEYLGDEIVDRIARVLEGRTPAVLGRFMQMLPNNSKLYVENVNDLYHASVLHLFFTTFRLNRLSQRGGIILAPGGGHRVSYSVVDQTATGHKQAKAASDYADQKIPSESGHRWDDRSVPASTDEFGDGATLQTVSVFHGFVLQQIQSAIAVRQILPPGVWKTELNWVYPGFDGDTAQLRDMRLRQANPVGPAGYVSIATQRSILGVGRSVHAIFIRLKLCGLASCRN